MGLTQLLCRLAWWVLWKWWPDRTVYIYNAGGMGGLHLIAQLTPERFEEQRGRYDSSWFSAVERLDHGRPAL